MEKIIPALASMALIIFGIFMTYTVWILGDDESDYEIVCLGGHSYWRANFAAKGFLGIKLDSGVKPVPCQ